MRGTASNLMSMLSVWKQLGLTCKIAEERSPPSGRPVWMFQASSAHREARIAVYCSWMSGTCKGEDSKLLLKMSSATVLREPTMWLEVGLICPPLRWLEVIEK